LIWLGAGILLIAAILALIFSVQSQQNPSAAHPPVGIAVGDLAPDFTLPDLQGNPIKLSSFRGKPVLVHFWGVACTTCQAEQPTYLKVVKDLGKKAPTILAVNTWNESAATVSAYVGQAHLPGIQVLDGGDLVFQGQYQGQGTPTAFYIDAHGVIKQTTIGAEDYSTMMANMKLIVA